MHHIPHKKPNKTQSALFVKATEPIKGRGARKTAQKPWSVLLCGCKGDVCHSHTPVPPQAAAAGKGTPDKVRLWTTHTQISPAEPPPAQVKYG